MTESAFERRFKIHFNSNINKFKGIEYSREVTILSNADFNAISIFAQKEQQFSNTPISIALIYRSPKSPLYLSR